MVLGDLQGALMLPVFVFFVVGIAFVQQRRTERSLKALRELLCPLAVVRRSGMVRKTNARQFGVW